MFRSFGEHSGFNPEKIFGKKPKKVPDTISENVADETAQVAFAQRERDQETLSRASAPQQPTEMTTEKPRLTRPAGAPSAQDALADLRWGDLRPQGAKRGKDLARELTADLLAEQANPAHEPKENLTKKTKDPLAETMPIPPFEISRLRQQMNSMPENEAPNLMDTVPASKIDAPLRPRPDSDTVETNQPFARSSTKTETPPFFDPTEIEVPYDLNYDDFETELDSRNNPAVPTSPGQEMGGETEEIDVEDYLFPDIKPYSGEVVPMKPATQNFKSEPNFFSKMFGKLFGRDQQVDAKKYEKAVQRGRITLERRGSKGLTRYNEPEKYTPISGKYSDTKGDRELIPSRSRSTSQDIFEDAAE